MTQGGGGGSLPPFWNPSPSSLLTGLGPEPLLRCGELTYRLELSCDVFRVSRGLAGVIPSPVRCRAGRGARLLRWGGRRAVYSAVLGQTDAMDISGWGGLKMNTLKRARRSPVIHAPARQRATRERCRGLLSFGARSQEKGWGKETHRAVRVFRFAVRVEKHSFRVFFLFSPLPPFLPRS